jgi:hypothetical protein
LKLSRLGTWDLDKFPKFETVTAQQNTRKMANRRSPEEAGFIRLRSSWVCKQLREDGLPCNESFSCKNRAQFEEHRLKNHFIEGPLPYLKPGYAAKVSDADKKAKHAARQAKYAAQKGESALQEMRAASKLKKVVEMCREAFDAQFSQQEIAQKPTFVLPGIMSFIDDALSEQPGRLKLD